MLSAETARLEALVKHRARGAAAGAPARPCGGSRDALPLAHQTLARAVQRALLVMAPRQIR